MLRRVVEGDRDSFRELYKRFYDRLLHFILRFTRRTDLAEEGVNDVMLVVWRDAAKFGGRSKVSTWIMGIAYRKALKIVERSRRWADRIIEVDIERLSEPSRAPGEPMGDAELQDWLDAGLSQLSTDHRAVVELTYFHGYSYAEIARIVDCPVNTVKTRMFNARARLKTILPSLAAAGAKPDGNS